MHSDPQRISTGASGVARGAIESAPRVREMFDDIAGRYDLLNHLLSAGMARLWWRRAANALRATLLRPEATIVDLCCGTGDMTLAMLALRPSTVSTRALLAVDFSHQMLSKGRDKFLAKNVIPLESDAMHLPLSDDSADLISAAFGFRNLPNYGVALEEIRRVLRPGGQIAILECNQPEGVIGALYNLYFRHILPWLGAMLSSSAAYRYLPESVERFPRPPGMHELFHKAGFVDVTWTSYTLGVAGLYLAKKPAEGVASL